MMVEQPTYEGNTLLLELNSNETNHGEQFGVPNQPVDFLITSPPPHYRNLFPEGYEYVAPTGDENNDHLPSYQSHLRTNGVLPMI